VVRVGEPFQLSVQLNANSAAPKLPELPAFSVLQGPGKSQSSQVSIINGKMTQSIAVSFNYILQANQEGTHDIPPIEVVVDKKNYQSQPVRVQVLAGTPSTSAPAQQGENVAQADNTQVKTDNREIFVSVLPNQTKIYQGEHLTANLKLFSQLDISSIDNLKFPSFDGFYKQEVETPPLRNLTRENVNGQVYGTGVLRQFVLFPQKSGTLTISPCTMDVGIAQQVQRRSRGFFDDIFGNSVQIVPRGLQSRPVEITVLPLPEGKPASFTGGVGQMKLDVSVDKMEVKANNPVVLKVVISGAGNIKFTDAPRINFPPDFEIYDPKINTNLNATITAGSKTFEYLIIPRHGGNYKLPAIEFSYFDPQAKQYKTLRSNEYLLAVEKGDEQSDATIIGGVTREEVKLLGERDIRYIKSGRIILRKADDNFFGTWPFRMFYLVSLLAFAVIVYFRRKYIRKYADAASVKNRRASRYAAKRLKQAHSYMTAGQTAAMYEELSRALWGYLGDKLNIPASELSKENGKLMMEQRQVAAAIADEFIAVIDDCEFARYAPAAEGADMKTLYDRAAEVINKLKIAK
jgi:hypothetical protein